MTLLKCQDGYLNQRVILFRLKYETHSLQMHPELTCRSFVAFTPKLLDQQCALSLVVVPCKYFPVRRRSSNQFRHLRRPISLLLLFRISSASVYIPIVPHLCHSSHLPLSSLLTLSSIPIIPHLHRASIVILPRLCCGSRCIIFHCHVYFAVVFFYLLGSDLLLALPFFVLHLLIHSAPHFFSHPPI